MFWLLTVGCLAAGALLGWCGLQRAVRARMTPEPAPPNRVTQLLLGASALLLVAPDLIPGLVTDYPGLAGTLALWGWRGFAMFLIGLVILAALITSRRAVRTGRLAAATAAGRMPSWSGWRARRQAGVDDLPRTWDGLLDYDRQLSRRLVSYQHDLELLANRPAMLDYTDPHTRAAIEAMTRCDRERREVWPITRDVILTPYGKAVAAFAVALREAEDNADRLARSGLASGEKERLAEATRILQFIQGHATTGRDREQAYRRVVDLLVVDHAPGEKARSHPWLDVYQRAGYFPAAPRPAGPGEPASRLATAPGRSGAPRNGAQ